ncbi:hypothetical protein D3C81_375560 [compost metagenome]
MDFSVEKVKDSIGGMFKGKKKWFVFGAIGIVAILAFMNRNKSSQNEPNTTVLSGYPTTQAGTSGGGGSSGGSSVDLSGISANFTDQITDLANGLTEAMQKQNEAFTSKMTDLASNNAALQTSNQTLLDSLTGLKKDNVSLAESLTGLKSTNDNLYQSLAGLQDANAGLNNQLSGLKVSFADQLAQRDSAYKKTLDEYQGKLSALTQSLNTNLGTHGGSKNNMPYTPTAYTGDYSSYPSSPTVGDFAVNYSNGTTQTYYQPEVGPAYQTSDMQTLQNNYNITTGPNTPQQQAQIDYNQQRANEIGNLFKGQVWNGSAWVTKP